MNVLNKRDLLVANVRGKRVCANIDRDSIYLCIPETPIEQTYPLAGLSPDEIYALLRGFAEQHTYR